ncbi:sigma 54-interacting transcriptional regulator [Nannocystis sp. RBIL2]|uniref:sigma-54-dependent transcriptional regulator n=1 Tax=Nannocystis sp. RBIL2 TaxID=2996788 RepID=UPI0022700D64|nr:sigma 54-interacting transcriptional regulator [Nannocystis sp. RBIL2]MCY1065603.1 sigma 54-interacting transcriptional regulator [Nannocystis sp. RBIL2]
MLTLLTDPESIYVDRIHDVVVLRQGGAEAAAHERVYEELVAALAERAPSLRLHPHVWEHDDPTDHAAIFEYLRALLPRIRRQFQERELVIHLSPGTAAMHTVWALMAATGFIEPPFTAVQSFRAGERRGRPAVVPLGLEVGTFFRRWQATRPVATEEGERAVWDPRQFRSTRLRDLYDEARRVARLKVPVLLLGERGTGKTTLASWIRLRSPFRKEKQDQAWPAVPCGQYTSETMRAELFGYVKGAFTGANREHEGLLARANGDTLFLDEIGDISRELQRLLIKVLEEGSYQPLGSTDVLRTDLRLLTATNLPRDALRKQLDPDFLDRIRSFTLTVPPLREIQDELVWLWPVVLEAAARRSGAPTRYARLAEPQHAQIVRALRADPLPGNVRDLFRVAYRFLAARADDDAPLPIKDAVDYALQALDGGAPDLAEASSRNLARAFADRVALAPDLLEDGPLDPERLIADFKRWFAQQVPGLSERTGRPESELTRMNERTLRNWRRKEDAGVPE